MESTYQERKNEILNKIFITPEEKEKIIQMKEIDLIKIISTQRKLITDIPEMLGSILRKIDPEHKNNILSKLFDEFCLEMDKHGITYKRKKILQKMNYHKTKMEQLKSKLEEASA